MLSRFEQRTEHEVQPACLNAFAMKAKVPENDMLTETKRNVTIFHAILLNKRLRNISQEFWGNTHKTFLRYFRMAISASKISDKMGSDRELGRSLSPGLLFRFVLFFSIGHDLNRWFHFLNRHVTYILQS